MFRMELQWASTIKTQLSVLVDYKTDIIIISLNITCSHNDIMKNSLFGVTQQLLAQNYVIYE
jgi:hypothetical protein